MDKTTFATTKTFVPAPEPPAHVHNATCWLTTTPECVKWRVTTLESENRELYGTKHHLLAKVAMFQETIRQMKGMLDKMDNVIERELKK